MKRATALIYFCFTVILLSGCFAKSEPSQPISDVPKNTIEQNEPKTIQTDIVQTNIIQTSNPLNESVKMIGFSQFTYHIKQVDSDYLLSIWFDKYEDGSFVESLPAFTDILKPSEGTLIYFDENKTNPSNFIWTIYFKQGESVNTFDFKLLEKTKYVDGVTLKRTMNGQGTSTLSNINLIKDEYTTDLGYLVYDVDDKGVYIDDDLQTNLENNKLVFVLKAKIE